jgi:hypothetical protein
MTMEERIAEIVNWEIDRYDGTSERRIIFKSRLLSLFTEQQVEALDVAFDKGFDTGKMEGQIQAKQQQAVLVDALEVGKNEIWRLRHESMERPERTLNVLKQMTSALKEIGK